MVKLSMQKIGKYFNVYFAKVRKLINIVIIILFGVQVVVVFSEVVSRYVFNSPFFWSGEMARYIQVWMILLASTIAVRKNTHLSVDFLTYKLNFRYKKILKIVAILVVMFYIFIVIIYGWKLVLTLFRFGQTSPALLIPMYLIYLAIPVTGLLMFLEALIRLLKLIRLKNNYNKDLKKI